MKEENDRSESKTSLPTLSKDANNFYLPQNDWVAQSEQMDLDTTPVKELDKVCDRPFCKHKAKQHYHCTKCTQVLFAYS
jgi:hypothetical protein